MNVCVYGASSNHLEKVYLDACYELGKEIATRGMGLVFGGGAQGLMGQMARGAQDHGGYILGVAPTFFDVEGVLYQKCSEFIFTETMRERKAIMEERADAFIMAPGGFGTFEEFFEILTLKQLGRHNKAIVILNVNGYYDALHDLIEHAISQHFVNAMSRNLYSIKSSPKEVLGAIETYKPLQGYMDHKRVKSIEDEKVSRF